MPLSRRELLKRSCLTVGAVTLPTWILEAEAEAAAAVDRHRLADAALSQARRLGATYADIRINRYRNEYVATREKQVEEASRDQNFGFGVRVMVEGAWGLAASHDVRPEAVRRVTRRAVEIARANAPYQKKGVALVPVARVEASWKSPFEKDPFEVSFDDKVQFLLKLNEMTLKIPGVSFVNTDLTAADEQKFFASTEGSRIEQRIVRTAPGYNVTAVDATRGEFQSRHSFAGAREIGYEYLETHPWSAELEKAGHEAVEKLKAKAVEPGAYDLVILPSQLWLTIHESVGHATELDRALGWEADFAGTSFLTPDKTGTFQYGSRIVNLFADRTQLHGLATVGYDDEGVPAQRWYLVKEGVFVDWQTTRELAGRIGHASSYGCCYADNWGSVPMQRIPNVSLEPSKEKISIEDLLADVQKGILIDGAASWSIDQQRLNFQFGGQTFWEIKDGKKGGMLRDGAYQSRTPEFWAACDGLGGEETYELNGVLGDGKGQPIQANAMSHGCPVARFRTINVLNTAGKK